MNSTATLTTRKLSAGHYALLAGRATSVAMDGRYDLERMDGEYGVEWRLFELQDGYRGEWVQTFTTKADAVAAAGRIHASA